MLIGPGATQSSSFAKKKISASSPSLGDQIRRLLPNQPPLHSTISFPTVRPPPRSSVDTAPDVTDAWTWSCRIALPPLALKNA